MSLSQIIKPNRLQIALTCILFNLTAFIKPEWPFGGFPLPVIARSKERVCIFLGSDTCRYTYNTSWANILIDIFFWYTTSGLIVIIINKYRELKKN